MDKKQYLKKRLIVYGIVAVLLIGYYLFVNLTGYAIPCGFHLVTGYRCPGCGISRMLMALARGDVMQAFHYNPVLLILLPFVILNFFWYWYVFLRYGKTGSRFNTICLWIYIVVLVVFGVIRNIVDI